MYVCMHACRYLNRDDNGLGCMHGGGEEIVNGSIDRGALR